MNAPGPRPTPPDLPAGGGLLLVDKPTGCTSHDVVAQVRRLLGTRRVGHAGTLDPMATGLLVLAVGRATRLLGHLALADKTYRATVRLGRATSTDDADGDPVRDVDAAGLDTAAVREAMLLLTGDLMQVPSAVSAVKVDGKRAYERVRAGEQVVLAARPVRVDRFEIIGPVRHLGGFADCDVVVDCSKGTYVRALARDLGAALGAGGHLTRLRRTRSGPFDVGDAVDVYGTMGPPPRGTPRAELPGGLAVSVACRLIAPANVAETAFPTRAATAEQAAGLRHGRAIPAVGIRGTYAVMDPADGTLLALVAEDDGQARPKLVWQPAD